MAGRQVMRVRAALRENRARTIPRLRHDLRVVPASGGADGIEEGLPVWKPFGPPVAEFPLIDIESRDALRRSARRGHEKQRRSGPRSEQDHAAGVPASSEADWRVAHGDWHSA